MYFNHCTYRWLSPYLDVKSSTTALQSLALRVLGMLEYWLYDILRKIEDSKSILNCGYDNPYRLELATALRTGKGFEVVEICPKLRFRFGGWRDNFVRIQLG